MSAEARHEFNAKRALSLKMARLRDVSFILNFLKIVNIFRKNCVVWVMIWIQKDKNPKMFVFYFF